jgi:hypothetical protein
MMRNSRPHPGRSLYCNLYCNHYFKLSAESRVTFVRVTFVTLAA